MSSAEPRRTDVPVDGGALRVLLWGSGERLAVAVHGITGSGMSWRAVGSRIPAGWTLAAPDLAGRGASSSIPGAFGMNRHVKDLAAVISQLGGHADVLAGHSMGAYVALLGHRELARRGLVGRLVLVDGGLPLPVRPDADLDRVLEATLGPAITRLRQTFADRAEYVAFWRAHPAFGEWTEDAEAYVSYDLTGPPGAMRSRVNPEAVRTDGRELLASGEAFGAALEQLTEPSVLLTAHGGMLGQPPGLLPPELVATWQSRAPALRPHRIATVNHYTIMFAPDGVKTITAAIAEGADHDRGQF